MNIENYRIIDKDMTATLNADGLAAKLKRDFAIGIGVSVVLAFFSDKRPLIEDAALISFALTFIAFIVRLFVFLRNSKPLKCSQCRGVSEKCKKGDESYIVCHNCRTTYFAYKPSTDPDKIFEEIKPDKNR